MEEENCVLCWRKVNIEVNTPIDQRRYYIVGVGQLCVGCSAKIYPEETVAILRENVKNTVPIFAVL